MTCREKLNIEYPSEVGSSFVGGCCGCPHHFGYLDSPEYCVPDTSKAINKCTKCWDREIPGTEKTKEKEMYNIDHNYLNTKSYEELINMVIEDDLRIRDKDERISVMERQIEDKDEKINLVIKNYKDLSDITDSYHTKAEDLKKKIKDLQDTIDIIEREKTSRIRELHEKNENLKDTIESKNGLIGTLKQKITNLNEKNELLLKDNQYVRDANRLSAEKDKEKIESLEARLKVFEDELSELKEKNESLEKDVSNYRDIIAMRDRRLDAKEADIHNLRETIEFYERHVNRIEGELKLYKGMKVDNNKTDYNTYTAKLAHCGINKNNTCFKPDMSEGHADPVGHDGVNGETGFGQNIPLEEPICESVPSSAVIGKIHCLKANWVVDEEPHVVFKLPRDAVKKLTGKDNWSNIDYLIMPTDMYKDVLNKDLEEHMKKYRDTIDQYRYYSRFLDSPCLNITPDTTSNPIPPVAKDYKAIAEHNFQKFTALQEAGFTEDQAMSLIPIWTDDED